MAKTFTDEDDALLAELGVELEPKRSGARTAREERIVAGFEEVQRFVDEKGHLPRHDESGDIFERLYAVRLDRLRDRRGGVGPLGRTEHVLQVHVAAGAPSASTIT